MLDTPLVRRLDMVLEYTRKERVLQFERGLDTLERAAAAVLQREELLAQFAAMQQVGADVYQSGCSLQDLARPVAHPKASGLP